METAPDDSLNPSTASLDPPAGDAHRAHSEALSKRAARNTIALIGGRIAGIALTGASSVLLTRCLGAAGYGQYASVQAYVLLFAWAASFGLEAILPRELAKRPEATRNILISASLMSAGLSALALVAVLASAPTLGYSGLIVPVALMGIDIVGLTPLRLPGAAYQADLRQWYSVTAGIVRQTLWVVVLIAAWAAHAGLLAVIVGRLAASIVEIALLLWGLRSRLRRSVESVVTPAQVKELLRASLPIALTALATCISRRVDQVILHRYVASTSVGQYAAAANLVELFNILPTAVMSSLFPLLVRSQHARVEFDRYVAEATRYLLVCAFGACLVVTLFGRETMSILFGAGFAGAGRLAAVLVWSEIASFVAVVMTNVVLAQGLQRFLPVATVVGAVVNLGLNLILIPRHGPIGAAWATVISYSAVSLILLVGPRETRSVLAVTGKAAAAPAALTAAALLITRAMPDWRVARLAVAIAIFLAGLLATRTVRLAELRLLGSMMFRRKTKP